jgi:hypothetical protein
LNTNKSSSSSSSSSSAKGLFERCWEGEDTKKEARKKHQRKKSKEVHLPKSKVKRCR